MPTSITRAVSLRAEALLLTLFSLCFHSLYILVLYVPVRVRVSVRRCVIPLQLLFLLLALHETPLRALLAFFSAAYVYLADQTQ